MAAAIVSVLRPQEGPADGDQGKALYAATALTILGPLATTAVALQRMSEMSGSFDGVQGRAQDEALVRGSSSAPVATSASRALEGECTMRGRRSGDTGHNEAS